MLTLDAPKIRHETLNGQRGGALPDSDICIAQGNYVLRGQRIVSDFVLETKTRENDVRFLCAKLNKDANGTMAMKLMMKTVVGSAPVAPSAIPAGTKTKRMLT